MAEVAEQQREEVADTPAAVSSGAPKADADIDGLLAEYQAATGDTRETQSDTTANEQDGDLQQEAVAALRDMDASAVSNHADSRLTELQNRNAELEAHIHREQEQAAFRSFAADLQEQLPEHLPPDYAETQLMAEAAKNPELVFAWGHRDVDRRAVDAELRKVESALAQLERNPSGNQQKIAALYEYGYRLGLAFNSKEIICNLSRDIVKRGSAHKPIDPEATADRAAIAAAVRDGRGAIETKEPPPSLGKMSDDEFRKYKETLGIY
jgi:hypothetical protein